MPHRDLSIWAFEKLADTKYGVIGTMWRDVPCWQKPSKPARVPSWRKPTPGQTPQQAGCHNCNNWNKAMDKRPRGYIDGHHRKALL